MLTYQNSSAALQSCVLSVDSDTGHSSFPEPLLVDISESGQSARVELCAVETTECDLDRRSSGQLNAKS
jgi:hypothetical protein